jgi:PilZ domain
MASASTGTDARERRHEIRKNVLWAGQIGANARQLDCTILDVSLGGARIRVNEEVPSRGPLTIACDRFGTFHAEVSWEAAGMAGLRFLESQARIAETIGLLVPLT